MNQLQIIEHNQERVMTTAQLAEGYGTTAEKIKQNFHNNKERYLPGKHFYLLEGEALRAFKREVENFDLAPNLNKLYLWTEHGALLHAKSLGTDRAWEVYEKLVETYFRVKERAQLSPTDLLELQVKALREMERRQDEQGKAIAAVDARLDGIKDAMTLDTRAWREDTRRLVAQIARAWGGNGHIKDVYEEAYRLVESRGGVKLGIRLENKRKSMAAEGVCKSKRDGVTKVDVIADDKKLVEIYTAILKEMAVKYCEPEAQA